MFVKSLALLCPNHLAQLPLNMKKYLTADQYRAKVCTMSIKELEVLVETFTIHHNSLNKEEMTIARILDAEIERRIAQWEAQS